MGDTNVSSITSAPDPPGTSDQLETRSSSEQQCACTITLSFDEQSGLVHAHLAPSNDSKPSSLNSLRTQLEAAGFGAYYAPESSLEAIVKSANNREPGDFVIAERRDAKIEGRISDDKQTAYLTVHPAWGGKPATRALITKELTRLAIPERCLLQAKIDEMILAGHADNQLVAQAIAPIPGQDSRFEVMIDSSQDSRLVEDEKGRVDMRELYVFLSVEPNTPLMRRLPATAGKPGINVVGEPEPAKAGKELPFAKDCSGTELDPSDANILLASIKGHPVTIAQGIRVDPVLRIKNVDLTTGNIDFDGSVEVMGDVTSGFVVKATGDIMVRGMVEQAYVYAAKNLTIAGGVMGEQQGQDARGQPRLGARLRAGQDFTAKFINLAEVTTGADLIVREYALQCQLYAGRDLLLGQPIGKGSLIGGVAKAKRALIANILGSVANVAGTAIVGKTPRRKRLLNSLRKELELCEGNRNKLTAMLAAADKSLKVSLSKERLDQALRATTSLQRRSGRLRALIKRITAQQQTNVASEVQIKRQLHANVSITIEGVRHIFNHDQGPCHLVRSGAELVKK